MRFVGSPGAQPAPGPSRMTFPEHGLNWPQGRKGAWLHNYSAREREWLIPVAIGTVEVVLWRIAFLAGRAQALKRRFCVAASAMCAAIEPERTFQ